MNYQTISLEMGKRESGSRPFPAKSAIPARWLTFAVCASAVVVLALMVQNRLGIAWSEGAFAALVSVFAGLGTLRYGLRRPASEMQRRLRDGAEYLLLLLGMSAIGGIASYAAASDTHGYADALLARMDQRLHFNWLDWYTTVAAHPVLQHLGAAAYGSIYISPLTMLCVMAWQGDDVRARRFLATFWLAATLTLVLFPLFPAKGALEYLWRGPIPYMPTNGLYQGEIIPALRAHTFGSIQIGALRGLVCAPSFHTVCATLYIATALPMRRLRWALVPLNAVMLLSTPVEGTHYLSDMVIGFMVAMFALVVVRWGAERLARLADPVSIWS